jgi:hypothetical protein
MDISYSTSGRQPAWMASRLEILPHLRGIGNPPIKVCAALPGQAQIVPGELGGDPSNDSLDFFPASSFQPWLTPPPPGISLRVDYEHKNEAYKFYARLLGHTPGGPWRLSLPRSIEHSDRRLVVRYKVLGEAGFSVVLGTATEKRVLPLHDLSTEGLCFAFLGRDKLCAPGDVLAAELHMPIQGPFRLFLGVMNLRPMESVRSPLHEEEPADAGKPDTLAGARLLGLGPSERHALALGISLWDIVRGRRASLA